MACQYGRFLFFWFWPCRFFWQLVCGPMLPHLINVSMEYHSPRKDRPVTQFWINPWCWEPHATQICFSFRDILHILSHVPYAYILSHVPYAYHGEPQGRIMVTLALIPRFSPRNQRSAAELLVRPGCQRPCRRGCGCGCGCWWWWMLLVVVVNNML